MHIPFGFLTILSFVLTGLMIGHLRKKGIHDVPNSRSLHTVPVPRGGGLVIVFASITGGLALIDPLRVALAFFVPGVIVAAAGFLDDLRNVSARSRLVAHVAAALILLALLRDELQILQVLPHWASLFLATLCLVAATNFTNFMDGINGIAAGQALLTGVVAMGVAPAAEDPILATLGLALAASSLGFLPWNFPRARIFMGDVGSGFVGFQLGVILLRGLHHAPQVWAPLCASIFLFWLDPLVTLFVRWRRGERLTEAHRTHAYQRLAMKWGSHAPVTLLYLGLESVLSLALYGILHK